jgi:hypothetical protein
MLPVGDSLDLIGLISHEKITPDTRITTMAACRSQQIINLIQVGQRSGLDRGRFARKANNSKSGGAGCSESTGLIRKS